MGYDQPRNTTEKPVNCTGLVIRADASTQIGSGHVMRCLALAQEWQDQVGGTVTFVSDLSDGLRVRLEAEGIHVCSPTAATGSQQDAKQVIETAQQLATNCIVVDGYCFGSQYQKWLKDARLQLLVLDDYGHADHYYADLVLNQNIHANENLYPNCEPYTQKLLGTRYALLRREFWTWSNWQREISDVARNVLVTMGGSDPNNVTLKVLYALEQISTSRLTVHVIVGGANPHYDALQAAAQHSPHSVTLEQNVYEMPKSMAWADVAVSAGGGTCWEMAFMGLPSVVIVLADNQLSSVDSMGKQGMVMNLGWYLEVSPAAIAESLTLLLASTDLRKQMSLHGRELVDAHGCRRVIKALHQARLHLRHATLDDCRVVFDWANEPSIREASFSSEPISWETHVAWFERTLYDLNKLFWIAENNMGKPVGQVRFALDNYEATISIGLDKSCRGKGYGTALISQSSWLVFDKYSIDIIHAYIKKGNIASEKAFAKAGYLLATSVEINDQVVIHMILEKP